MSYILTTGALIKILGVNENDEIYAWLQGFRVRPYVDPATMALVNYQLQVNESIKRAMLKTLRARWEAVRFDLMNNKRGQFTLVDFDLSCAEALADLLAVDCGHKDFSELELVPAAIAIQNNFTLVITETDAEWRALAEAIPKELGTLNLRAFDTGSH